MKTNLSISDLTEEVNPSCSSSISRHYSFLKYPVSVKIKRWSGGENVKIPKSKRLEIKSFSWKSKGRLRFTATNSLPALISQFGLTYHTSRPDGRQVKKHLDNFLRALRRKYPTSKYLWILEFQKRAVPHFHLFLSLPVSGELQDFLAKKWNSLTEPLSLDHLWWHLRKSENPKMSNFIPWEMRSAGYLCKYLSKESQKRVPEGFTGIGRFWGCSQNLVPEGEEISFDDLDQTFLGVAPGISGKILRTLCKHHEKKNSWMGKFWKGQARKSENNYTLIEGRKVLDQLINFYEKEPPF